jgi:hypothetical protein
MNSWSSIPKEYVVWFWIVAKRAPIVHRALALLLRQRVPGAELHEGVDDEIRLPARHDLARLAGVRVLGRLRRCQIGVRSRHPARQR